MVGVVVIDEGRTGAVNTEFPTGRLVETVSLAKDRSRNAYSLLYTRGGQGGWPKSGGSLRVRLRLEMTVSQFTSAQRIGYVEAGNVLTNRLHAISAHAYGLAISSSGLRLMA